MTPLPFCENVPFSVALVQPLSSALAVGARPSASTPRRWRRCLQSVSYFDSLCSWLPPIWEGAHSSSSVLLPPVQAAGTAQMRPRSCIFFVEHGETEFAHRRTHRRNHPSAEVGAVATKLLARLTEHVYPELRLMARRYMTNESPGHSLQATALVNEVYLRLVDVSDVDWQARAQFFAIAAQLMRRILVDAARKRGSRRRDGILLHVNLDESVLLSPSKLRVVLRLGGITDLCSRPDSTWRMCWCGSEPQGGCSPRRSRLRCGDDRMHTFL